MVSSRISVVIIVLCVSESERTEVSSVDHTSTLKVCGAVIMQNPLLSAELPVFHMQLLTQFITADTSFII